MLIFTSLSIRESAPGSEGVIDCSAEIKETEPSVLKYLIFTYLRVYTESITIPGLAPLYTKFVASLGVNPEVVLA